MGYSPQFTDDAGTKGSSQSGGQGSILVLQSLGDGVERWGDVQSVS